jgi:acetyl esterase/lipase
VSPIHVAHKLPPTHVLCGTADGLIEDARRMVAQLNNAGIAHEQAFFEDMPHGFSQLEEFFPEARRSIDGMVAFLNKHV